jgi:hypothetical protein
METLFVVKRKIRENIVEAFRLWKQALCVMNDGCTVVENPVFQEDEFLFFITQCLMEARENQPLTKCEEPRLPKAPRRVP